MVSLPTRGTNLRRIASSVSSRTVQRDRTRTQALHRERKISQAAVARQRFAQQADCAGVYRLTVGPGDRVLQPAGTTQCLDESDACGVDVVVMTMAQGRGAPGLEAGGQSTVPLFEEGPFQMRLMHGQLPSKLGRCLATNAW